MTRTIRIKLYKFNELSEHAKKKAIEWFEKVGGNIDNEWWDTMYEDAANVGIKITAFNLDRGSYCKGGFIEDALHTANKIKEDHGEQCETYKTAVTFLAERDKIVNEAAKDANGEWEDENELDKKLDDCEVDFLKSILEDYRIMLSQEYDYLTSTEAMIESIVSSEYEFTKDGKRF